MFRRSVVVCAGALDGIKVLDLSRILAGPYCTQMLGDMGAEIIKVEQPGNGDETRSWGPPFVNGESSYFLSVNRNKKSIAIDLKSKPGRDIITKLVKTSDVLVENFLPGKLEEMGLGYAELSKVNPGLIYCSLSGFGRTGKEAKKPGFDIICSAMYGMMHITGPEGGKEVVKPGVAMTDVSTGLLAHGAILAALYERTRSGIGQHVDTSLMEAQLSTLVNVASSYLSTGEESNKRWGTAHPSIVPYQAFECGDGASLVIAIGSNKHFTDLCHALDASHLLPPNSEQYSDNAKRVANRGQLIPALKQIFASKNRQEWETIFKSYHFPYGPVRSIQEAFEDEQALHRDMVVEVGHPVVGALKVVGHPVKYSRTPACVRLPPPLLGQHTTEVLKELTTLYDSGSNITEAEIEEWMANGYIQQNTRV